jgi:hypothetical protein
VTASQLLSFEHAPSKLTAEWGANLSSGTLLHAWEPLRDVRSASSATFDTEVFRAEQISHACDLVVTDASGGVIASLALSLTERVRIGQTTSIKGSDASTSLALTVSSEIPPTSVRLRIQFHPAPDASPRSLLPPIEFLEALRPDRLLGLRLTEVGSWAAAPEPIPADHPTLPVGYGNTVRALARLQRRAHVEFPMPSEISEEDVQEILQGLRLVDGGTITGTWSDATMVMDAEGADLLREQSSPHGAMLEFTSEVVATVAGHDLPLGLAGYRFAQVLVADELPEETTAGEHAVRLQPGRNNQFEISLLAPDSEQSVEQGQPPASVLERYAGMWIAQRGVRIIAGHESREELLRSLRSTGERATVWRVPSSRDEAEAVAIGL